MAELKEFAEQLVNLSVKEVNELANILKDEYGIEPAAAAVAVAGPAAEGGDEAGQPDASTSGAKTKKKNDSTAKKGKTAASAPANPEVSGARQNQLQLSEAGIV